MNITLHIERVVLDGITMAPRDRPLFQAALEAELGRLLGDTGLAPALQGGGSIASLPGGGVSSRTTGADLGRQVGRAVYGAIRT